MRTNIYKALRQELEQVLENNNQHLLWETLESFTDDLIDAAQNGLK